MVQGASPPPSEPHVGGASGHHFALVEWKENRYDSEAWEILSEKMGFPGSCFSSPRA